MYDIIYKTELRLMHNNQGVIEGLSEQKVLFASMIHNLPITFTSLSPPVLSEGRGSRWDFFVPARRWRPQTYSFVLLGGLERELAMDGYLDTFFFRGQEAASMAPPRTSRREPPQAMKMAAPNSNLAANETSEW